MTNGAASSADGSGAARISIVVPVRHGGAPFRVCMAHLAACRPSAGEVIVVIDGRSDGADSCARAAGARVISLPVPAGPAAARNAGAAAARGDVLLFVDADVAVPPDLVGRVAACMDADPGLVAVMGSYDDEPGDRRFLSQYRNLLHHYVHQTGREDASTFWCACGAVRRSAFLGVGGLDPRFGAAMIEDIELGYRLRAAGHRIKLCKDLQAKHLKRWTAFSMVRTDVFARAVPWTRLVLRSRAMPNDLNLKTGARASVVLAAVLALSLAAAPWRPSSLAASAGAAAALVALNAGFYRFLWRKRGPFFLLASLPWHWLYFACAGAGFVVGAALEAFTPSPHAARARSEPATAAPGPDTHPGDAIRR